MDSENKIIKALKGENQEEIDYAFNFIYNKYSKLVYTCIFAIVRDTRDAEELTNDTFLRLFSNRYTICEQKNLKFYIISIAKHLAIDFYRKKKLEVILDEKFVYECATSQPTSTLKELKEVFCKYISKEDAEIIFTHIIFGETFQAIASHSRTSIHTVKSRYFRAINKLRKEMRPENEEL